MPTPSNSLIHVIDTFTEISGTALSYLCLLMMGFEIAAIALNLMDINAIALQEAALYCHGTMLMLGIAYGLKNSAHVRVDIFYSRFSMRPKAWVDTLGGVVFTLPLCVFVFVVSQNYVANAWAIREISTEPGGLPAVFLLKTLIPAMAVLLAFQALGEVLRGVLCLGRDDA